MTTHPIRWSSGCRSCHGKTWLCLLPFPIIQNPATARERSGNVAMTTQRNARSVPVNCLERESLLCTSRCIADSYKRSEVRTGDLVMAIRATVGKVLPVPCDLDGANLTQGTARIALSVRTNPSFLLWAIRHHRAQKSILAEIKGTTFAEIALADLRQVPLAAPIEFEEQRLIGQRVQACDDAIQCEQHQLVKLRAQKFGLMDDLLTGRVRVTLLLEAATA
ncbi:MAG TPA: restriction endonuclease subunit S [Rhodanobacter sp.]|nr:restriction endonuclease subunit S [Rhodanobacter sp.]